MERAMRRTMEREIAELDELFEDRATWIKRSDHYRRALAKLQIVLAAKGFSETSQSIRDVLEEGKKI